MSDTELAQERRALLALELAANGADVRRLGFVAWLVSHDRDPEWCGNKPPRRRRTRKHAMRQDQALPIAA